ncbi:hypothetical protein [uncultured Polaribacter sp.]|uniref:hypothetical protein n=1 Tax=uncultured Polaribacter sp. TaxID=174711 RepID=UPI00262800F0|nr:hypothetical protein [uncultured Polaribacter sp.]
MATSNYWIVKNENFEFIQKIKGYNAPKNIVHLTKPIYLSNGVSVKYTVVYKRKKKINCSRLNFIYQGHIIYKRDIAHTSYYMDKFGNFVDDLNSISNLSNQELAALLLKAQTKAWEIIKKEREQIEKLITKLKNKNREKEKALADLNQIISLTKREL